MTLFQNSVLCKDLMQQDRMVAQIDAVVNDSCGLSEDEIKIVRELIIKNKL